MLVLQLSCAACRLKSILDTQKGRPIFMPDSGGADPSQLRVHGDALHDQILQQCRRGSQLLQRSNSTVTEKMKVLLCYSSSASEQSCQELMLLNSLNRELHVMAASSVDEWFEMCNDVTVVICCFNGSFLTSLDCEDCVTFAVEEGKILLPIIFDREEFDLISNFATCARGHE